jgi:hypothetical protein
VAPAPASVSSVGWTKKFDGITDINVGGPGLIMAQGDTVTGVDGATGDPVWSYQRIGAGPISVEVSPDGTTAYLGYSNVELAPINTTVLNAATGEVRDEAWWRITWRGLNLTNHVIADTNGTFARDATAVIGFSASDASELWRQPLAEGCDYPFRPDQVLAAGDSFLLQQWCNDDRLHLYLVDARTGGITWTWTSEPRGENDSITAAVGRRRSDVVLVTNDRPKAAPVVTALDLATGRPEPIDDQDVDDWQDKVLQTGSLADAVVSSDQLDYRDPQTAQVTVTSRAAGRPATTFDVIAQLLADPRGDDPSHFNSSVLAGPGGAYLVATRGPLVPNGIPSEPALDVSVTELR